MTKPQRIVKSSHISLTSIALELYSRVKAAAIEVVWLFHSIVIRHIWPGMEFGQWTSTYQLTHWGRVMHICISKLSTNCSNNGLSPGRRQAIIWTNDEILSIRTLGTNFREILSQINSFSFKKMHLKMSSAKWCIFHLGLNELNGDGVPWNFFPHHWYSVSMHTDDWTWDILCNLVSHYLWFPSPF